MGAVFLFNHVKYSFPKQDPRTHKICQAKRLFPKVYQSWALVQNTQPQSPNSNKSITLEKFSTKSYTQS